MAQNCLSRISSRRIPIPWWIAHRRRTTTRWKVSKPSNRERGSGLRSPAYENECELICLRAIGDPLAMSRENPRLEERERAGGLGGWVYGDGLWALYGPGKFLRALPLAEVLPAGWQKAQRELAEEVHPAGWQKVQRVLALPPRKLKKSRARN